MEKNKEIIPEVDYSKSKSEYEMNRDDRDM